MPDEPQPRPARQPNADVALDELGRLQAEAAALGLEDYERDPLATLRTRIAEARGADS